MGSFSCSIPPSFVLSHNIPVTNATSNWLRFAHFLASGTPLASARYARIRRLHSHPTCPQSLSPGTEASSDHRHSPTAPVTFPRWVPEASFRRSAHHHTHPTSPRIRHPPSAIRHPPHDSRTA